MLDSTNRAVKAVGNKVSGIPSLFGEDGGESAHRLLAFWRAARASSRLVRAAMAAASGTPKAVNRDSVSIEPVSFNIGAIWRMAACDIGIREVGSICSLEVREPIP